MVLINIDLGEHKVCSGASVRFCTASVVFGNKGTFLTESDILMEVCLVFNKSLHNTKEIPLQCKGMEMVHIIFSGFWPPIFFNPFIHSSTDRQAAPSLIVKPMCSQICARKASHPGGYQNNETIVILLALHYDLNSASGSLTCKKASVVLKRSF